MLVLTRKTEETIHIGGNITVKVLRIAGHGVKLGIEAPDGVLVVRGELLGKLTKPPNRSGSEETAQRTGDTPASNTGGRCHGDSGSEPAERPSDEQQGPSGPGSRPSCPLRPGRHAPRGRTAASGHLPRRAGPAATAP